MQRGLAEEEILQRRALEGFNELPRPKSFSKWALLFRQFGSPLVWLLIAAALIACLAGERVQVLAIGAILILNACLGFYQEFRSEKAFDALKKLLVPVSTVLRGGAIQQIPSRELVPGDQVLLQAGDQVPADGQLIESASLAVDESALTGESRSVHKALTHSVFLGTQVVQGRGTFLVTHIGIKTELGKIALFLQTHIPQPTPLQGQLASLSHRLLFLCGGLVASLFLIGIALQRPWLDMLLTSVSLAVAAIPEGLPAIVTVSLAVGVQKMARQNALIRRLASVETLGCTTVICSDKTGTLTQNQMTLQKLWAPGDLNEEGSSFALQIGVLCNGASLSSDGLKIIGDPTEGALLVAAAKRGLGKKELEAKNPAIKEFPFDSDRKRMSILRKGPRLYVKGAPDVLLELSKTCLYKGALRPLDPALKREISRQIETWADEGHRVLALAYGDHEKEEDLTFVALAALIDPPRSDAKEAIEECRRAHMRPIMITGDHKGTAIAVAKMIGLFRPEDRAYEGKEIESADLEKAAVFARVSASQKLSLVQALQAKGHVVAMTGDGVNDAPAIQQADIGIAMGITGTDVAKGASDMVLLDDRFSTIVHAVREGRNLYDNLSRFLFYLLSANLAEVFVVFLGLFFGGTPLLIPVQILWINFVTDGFPALALAFDPLDPSSMTRPPRGKNDPILSRRMTFRLFTIALALALATLFAALYGLRISPAHGQTMAFTGLVVFELAIVWCIRWPLALLSNRKLLAAVAVSLMAQLTVLYAPPLQRVFQTVPLALQDWGILLVLSALCCIFTFWVVKKKEVLSSARSRGERGL